MNMKADMDMDMDTNIGVGNHVKRIVLTEESLQPKKKRNKNKKDNKNEDTYEDIYDDTNDSLCTDNHDDDDKRPTRKNRVITQTKKWETMKQHLTKDDQLRILHLLSSQDTKSPECVYMLQEIHRKINGYKCQDLEKQLYDPENFVDTEYVVEILLRSQLHCYYCKEEMHVLYAEVRNPKQWSLERIDNTYGHNKENVEIACLQCNLKRKTMYHERFLFTKQLGNIVKVC